jgi:hypothetical protein
METGAYNRNSSGEERGMKKLFSVGVAVIVAVALTPASATAVGPTDGEIDISGAELSGTPGGGIDVFGTLRCAGVGPVNLDVEVEQQSPGGPGMAAGANNLLTCPAVGYNLKWIVTATGAGFVTGEKIKITAIAAGSTIATDTEEHVLRWGG